MTNSKKIIVFVCFGLFTILTLGLLFRLTAPKQPEECSHLFLKTSYSFVDEAEHVKVTVCQSCGDVVESKKQNHVFEYELRDLTNVEKVKNPRAISRESLTCSVCGDYQFDYAVYENMTFDSSFDVHVNLSADSLPLVSGGKYIISNSLYLTDALHLSGKASALKNYSITFDVAVNLDPAMVDYHPSDGSGEKKPPIFFALVDGKNKWDYKNPALGVNRDVQNDVGAYELLLYVHNWGRLPSSTYSTDFFMELGKEYSIKMDFALDVNAGTYKVSLFACEVEAKEYTKLGTFIINHDYSNSFSYIYFEGKDNVIDNFKIYAPFVVE